MENDIVRKGHFKWDGDMLYALANLVYTNTAFMRVANEGTADEKCRIIVGLLWKLAAFKRQGQPVAWNTCQHKFQTMLKSCRIKHGLGEDGQRANISALSETSSELDIVLMEIHCIMARKEEADLQEKITEEEHTKVLSNVTHVIVAGGGVKGLLHLSTETAKTSSSSSSSGVKEFAAMSKKAESKKRVISQVDTEAALEMEKIVNGLPQDSPVVGPKGTILLFEELKTGPNLVALEAWGAEPRCSRSVSEKCFGESFFSNLSPFGA
jgi:hypothetical protein